MRLVVLSIFNIFGGGLNERPHELPLQGARNFASLAGVPMRKVFALPALLGFLYLNGALGLVVWVSRFNHGELWAFLISLPFAVLMVVTPIFLWGRLRFPRGLLCASQWLTLPFFIGVMLASMGTRQALLLSHGTTVTGLSVTEATAHPEAVVFEFTDGHGRADYQAMAINKHGRSADRWYAVPFVADNWTPQQPVTAWAVSLNPVPQDVLSGQFRAGMLYDEGAEEYRYIQQAVQEAIRRYNLHADPRAVFLEMRKSVVDFTITVYTFLILAFGMVNLIWGIAVLITPPITVRDEAVVRSPAPAGLTATLPLTPAMKECLRANIARSRRIFTLIVLGIWLFIVLLHGGMGALGEHSFVGFFLMGAVGGIVGLIFALIAGGIFLCFDCKNRMNLRASTFLRTRGFLRVQSFGVGKGASAFSLILPDRELLVDHRLATKAAALSRGTVDYMPYGHFVFEVRDASEQMVYRHPLYQPPPDRSVTQ
jgi:hypothetical protein